MEEKKVKKVENNAPHCSYFIKKKNRFCHLALTKSTDEFCSQHQMENKQLCPYDPGHIIRATRMNQHIKCCPTKLFQDKQAEQPYFQADMNLGSGEKSKSKRTPLSSISNERKEELIKKIESQFEKNVSKLVTEAFPNILSEKPTQTIRTKRILRHKLQTELLLKLMEKHSLLKDVSAFVEFGAGSALYSVAVYEHVKKPIPFLLVDKLNGIQNKFFKDIPQEIVTRVPVDIKDLKFSGLMGLRPETSDIQKSAANVVSYSKHLCGDATDLTLRSLASIGIPTKGILIALCCHHKGSFRNYCNPKYVFETLGFTPEDFEIILSMTTWATDGSHQRENDENEEEEEETNEKEKETNTNANKNNDGKQEEEKETQLEHKRHKLDDGSFEKKFNNNENENSNNNNEKIASQERMRIGKLCKRVVDYGRVLFLQQNGYKHVSLEYFAHSDLTLENCALIALS